MQTPFTCPPNSKRLFDLIHVFDEKLLPAFYFAFSDTLVTSSIDQVSFLILSYLELNGTMSGGGVKQSHGSMKLKDKNKRSSLGEEKIQQSMEELVGAVNVLEQRYNQIRKTFTEMKVVVDWSSDH